MPTFAAVDIGSNSVRLKIARLQAGRLKPLHEDREVTRLGEGAFRSGFLTPESMAETVKVLRRFHRATQQIVTDTVRVVATSALRDARNSQAFLEWVRSATGWRVEIISGVEEARLIHLGLISSPRIDSSPTLMIDLGGGSCELTVTQGGHIRDAVSLPLGAVRLTDEFLASRPVPQRRTETSARIRCPGSWPHQFAHRCRASEECHRDFRDGGGPGRGRHPLAPGRQPQACRLARGNDEDRETPGPLAGRGTPQD